MSTKRPSTIRRESDEFGNQTITLEFVCSKKKVDDDLYWYTGDENNAVFILIMMGGQTLGD